MSLRPLHLFLIVSSRCSSFAAPPAQSHRQPRISHMCRFICPTLIAHLRKHSPSFPKEKRSPTAVPDDEPLGICCRDRCPRLKALPCLGLWVCFRSEQMLDAVKDLLQSLVADFKNALTEPLVSSLGQIELTEGEQDERRRLAFAFPLLEGLKGFVDFFKDAPQSALVAVS